MFRSHSRVTSLAISGCLLVLLAACGPFGPGDSRTTTTALTDGAPARSTTGGVASTPTSAPMPATQTACPADGTARAAVFAPLALGPHQNIVYLFNQSPSPENFTGELKRYDVSNGHKVIIVTSAKSSIDEAQLSADGQWILFLTHVSSGEPALQLVRMDGQGLQTLYCSNNGLGDIQWSPDQKQVMFEDGEAVKLLDLATGRLQVIIPQRQLVDPTIGTAIVVSPGPWLDDTHIYLWSEPNGPGNAPLVLYALDTTKWANQQVSDFIRVFDYSGFWMSFDSNADHSRLFVSTFKQSQVGLIQQGPSTIIAEPALGGPKITVYSTPTFAITAVRVISSTTMLLLIENRSGDTSHNGLWKMQLDGTGLTRLTTDSVGQTSSLNERSLSSWSTISRDGSRYALKISSNQGTASALLVESLAGASSSTFATFSGIGNVDIVGWTTM